MKRGKSGPPIAIQAVDVHAHIGRYVGAGFALGNGFYSGGAAVVLERARMANTACTVVSSLRALLPRGHGQPIPGNREALAEVRRHRGLRLWAVVNPLAPATFTQAEELLALPVCVGIKVHPEEHRYPIRRHGRRIFEWAEAHGAVIQSHSGERNSMPEDFVPFADDFPSVRVILSHLGCGWDGEVTHQVRAIQRCRHGNLHTDTSSAKSITPRLLEWAVGEVGAEKILYGTDSPLYFAPMQRARVDHADLREADKRLILRANAERLLGL